MMGSTNDDLGKTVAEPLARLCRTIITELLRRIDVPMPSIDSSLLDDEVGNLVHAEAQTWDIGDLHPVRLERILAGGITLARTAYGHTPTETQVQLALWTALCISVDDLDAGRDNVAEFAQRFHQGHRQPHPLLDLLADKLRRMSDYFHDYGAAAIVTATVQAVAFTALENDIQGQSIHPAAGAFVQYKRVCNGAGEANAFAIWDKTAFPNPTTHIQAIPETTIIICFINDLLSFYKEELDGEKVNFIHDRTSIADKDIEGALTQTLDDVVAAVNRARNILTGEELRAWEAFLEGYVAFHFSTPRYKLKQLFVVD